jgi:hypothetical protein
MAKTLKTILSIDMSKFKAGLNNAKGAVAGFNKNLIQPISSLIKKVVRLGIVAGIAAGAFLAFGIKAAAGIQQAQLRLAGISSGVEDFKKTWKDTYDVFLRSPLELEESVNAMTTLKNAGVGTKESLEAVAGAAMLVGKDVQDTSLALLAMESKTLKRLGFTARSMKSGSKTKFEISGLDKAGKQISMVSDSIEDARKNLIQLLTVKYGGALDTMSRSFEGVMSTFRGVRQMAFFEVFKSSLTKLSPLIMMFNDKLIQLSESGALARFGERIGEFVVKAISAFTRLVQYIRNFSLREWAMENLGYVVAFGSVFTMVIGVQAVSAIMNLIQAVQLLPKAFSGALGIVAALAAGWGLGKLLEDKFDISYYVAKFMRGAVLVAKIVKNLATANIDGIEQARDDYASEVAILKKDHDALMESKKAGADSETANWIKDAFAKYKMISPEELAAQLGVGGPDQMGDMQEDSGKWRNKIDESARRGIGKIFGGGALGGGTEEKRTKAALAMVKKQGTTNELLQQVVRGFDITNTRFTGLAF